MAEAEHRGRVCVFCGGAPVTKEHVWPQWISGLLDRWGPFKITRMDDPMRWAPALDIQVRRVCGSCNSGWMSDLETRAQPVLEPLILAKPDTRLLSPAEQRILASWAMKTTLMAALIESSTAAFPAAEYERFLKKRLQPSKSTCIWLGARGGNTSAAQLRLKEIVPAGTDGPRLGVYARLTAFRTLFELASFDSAPAPRLPGAELWDDIAIRLWPPLGESRVWPEKRLAFNDESAERHPVTEPPPNTRQRGRRGPRI